MKRKMMIIIVIIIMMMMMMIIVIVVVVVVVIMITIIIAFKEPKSIFLTISSLRRETSPTRTLKWPGRSHVQITCNTSSA